MELSQEKEIYQATIEGRRVVSSPTSPGSDRRHITVELAETKAKLRRTRQELEEKNEMVLEYKEEIDKYNLTVQKLRQEVGRRVYILINRSYWSVARLGMFLFPERKIGNSIGTGEITNK